MCVFVHFCWGLNNDEDDDGRSDDAVAPLMPDGNVSGTKTGTYSLFL